MTSVALQICALSGMAWALYITQSPAYSYFYAILTLSAILLAVKSKSGEHIWVCFIIMCVYMMESNQEVWLVRIDISRIMYIAAGFLTLIARSPGGHKLAETVAVLLGCKLLISFLYPSILESGVIYQTGLNFISICYWLILINMTREHIRATSSTPKLSEGETTSFFPRLLSPIKKRYLTMKSAYLG